MGWHSVPPPGTDAANTTGLTWSLPAVRGALPDRSRMRPARTASAASPSATRGSTSAPAQTENRQQERGEEHLQTDDHERRGDDRQALFREGPEAAADPVHDHHAAERQSGDHDRAPHGEPVLEPKACPHTVEPGVLLAHEIGAVCVRA